MRSTTRAFSEWDVSLRRDGDDRPLSRWRRFPRDRQIGVGTFGNVFLCRDMSPTSPWHLRPVAVKVVPLETLSDNEVVSAMNEVAILRHLRHANILQYVDNFIDSEKQLCLVSEYVDGGDLACVLRRCSESGGGAERGRGDGPQTNAKNTQPRRWMESYRIADIVRQCLEALAYLHSCHIIHRDIKPANVYMTKNGVVKLGDFGVSKLLDLTDPMAATFVGTPFYLCPELCLGEPYSFGADIWALGVLTYEMYCMKLPFAGDNVLAQIHVVTEGKYDREALHQPHSFFPSQQKKLEAAYGSAFAQQEETLHRLVVALVERMLVLDPMERSSASQLLREFFISDPSRSISPIISRPVSSRSEALDTNSDRPRDEPHYSTGRLSIFSAAGTENSAALLASRVSTSRAALVEMLPLGREASVSRAAAVRSRPMSSVASGGFDRRPIWGRSSHELGLDVSVLSTTRSVITEEGIERIPWLRDARMFSSLSLREGYDDEVVRVEWMSDDHFSVVSPHRKRCHSSLLSPECGGDSSVASISKLELTALAAASISSAFVPSEMQKKTDVSLAVVDADAKTEERPPEEEEEQQQQPSAIAGRCQGLSAETLEALLRKKIMASYAGRQRRLKAMREAHAASEEERSRMRAELNELYAKSFSKTHQETMSEREQMGMDDTVKFTGDFAATQKPHPAASTSLARVATSNLLKEGGFWNSRFFERAIDRLSASSSHLTTVRRNMDPWYLSNEVARIARDASVVADRCARWSLQPPTRLDFKKRHMEEADRCSTSSVTDSQRGKNTEVYDIPVTLCIVSDESQVTMQQTSPLPATEGPAGSLVLPISVTLKPIRRETRLDGIVWRVKESLKAYGLSHALLFPLDIDDAEEVGAEELGLRYVDCVGDVIAIADASDWLYVKRDWNRRRDFMWMPLYMVKY